MIYMDNAATSFPKPPAVSRAMDYALRNCANPGRSGHAPALEAGRVILTAREKTASFLGMSDAMRVIFCLNCTDALNTAIGGLLHPGQHVVTTCLEHNSVLRPLYALQQSMGITWTAVPPEADGRVSPAAIARSIRRQTALVIITHASNVTGIVQPVEEIAALCRSYGIPLIADGAQSAGSVPVSLDALGADIYTFSGHKGLLGPQGVGGMVLCSDVMPLPLRFGGTGSMSSELQQPDDLPDRYESGTSATPAIAGLSASLTYLEQYAPAVRRHEAQLTDALLEGLRRTPGVRILCDPPKDTPRTGTVSFNIGDLDSSEAADLMWQKGYIASRSGLHCAPYTHAFYGTAERGAVRLSIGAFNSMREVDAVLRILRSMAPRA